MLRKGQGAIVKNDEKVLVTIITDGACHPNPGRAAYAWVIMGNGRVMRAEAKLFGFGTNNIAEYMGIQSALEEIQSDIRKSSTMQRRNLIRVFSDSELAVNQLNGVYRVKDLKLTLLNSAIKRVVNDPVMPPIEFHHSSNVDIAHNLAEALYHLEVPRDKKGA